MRETHAEQMHFTKQNPGQCINLITEILHQLANNSRIRFQTQKQKKQKDYIYMLQEWLYLLRIMHNECLKGDLATTAY